MWQKDIDKGKPWEVPVWAGYGSDGNDRNGHMHVRKEGNFYRSDGLRGDYCSAPLCDRGETCTDPPTYNLEDRVRDPLYMDQQDWEARVMSQEMRERS